MPHRSSLFFTTPDHVNIVGTFVLPDTDIRGAALLLHMMPSTRESFEPLQGLLAKIGIATFAIDLRGHGDSIQKEQTILDYKKFSDADHKSSYLDVESAAQYLCTLVGIPLSSVMVVGASIGANLALRFQAEHSEIELSLLLSPGISYHGVKTDDAIRGLVGHQQSVVFTSTEDSYSFESSLALHELAPERTIVEEQDGDEHGTALLLNTDTTKKIINYCDQWANNR